MKTLRKIQSWTTCLALLGLLTPIQPAAAQQTSARGGAAGSPLVRDIALDTGGMLSGVVVDGSGKPTSKPIEVTTQTGQLVTRAASSTDGRFSITGLRGGVYRLATPETSIVCRLWSPGAAPPVAAKQLLVISDPSVARGQRPIGELFCSPPFIVGALLVAAIVIPIAIHNSQDDPNAS